MTTSITLYKSLQVDLLSIQPGAAAPTLIRTKLSRIEAQRLAETLTAFAIGSTTKSAGAKRCDVFLGEDLSAPASATGIVRL